jgi:hypothetical protein
MNVQQSNLEFVKFPFLIEVLTNLPFLEKFFKVILDISVR